MAFFKRKNDTEARGEFLGTKQMGGKGGGSKSES